MAFPIPTTSCSDLVIYYHNTVFLVDSSIANSNLATSRENTYNNMDSGFLIFVFVMNVFVCLLELLFLHFTN